MPEHGIRATALNGSETTGSRGERDVECERDNLAIDTLLS
jgi:hypothetical protein